MKINSYVVKLFIFCTQVFHYFRFLNTIWKFLFLTVVVDLQIGEPVQQMGWRRFFRHQLSDLNNFNLSSIVPQTSKQR